MSIGKRDWGSEVEPDSKCIFEFPMDLTIKNSFSLETSCNLDFAGLYLVSKHLSALNSIVGLPTQPTHFLSDNPVDLFASDIYDPTQKFTPQTISSQLVNQLLVYRYPRLSSERFKEMFHSTVTALDRRRSRVKLSEEDRDSLRILKERKGDWQGSFTSLVDMVKLDLTPYFYYFSSACSVVFLSAQFHKELNPGGEEEVLAFLYVPLDQLKFLLQLRATGIQYQYKPYQDYQPDKLCNSFSILLQPSLPGLNPEPKSRLLIRGRSEVDHLVQFLKGWRPNQLEHYVHHFPQLLSPVNFPNGSPELPKLEYIRARPFQEAHDSIQGDFQAAIPNYTIKVEGLVLPTALRNFVQLLHFTQSQRYPNSPDRFQFKVKFSSQVHQPSCPLFGRWMVKDSNLPNLDPSFQKGKLWQGHPPLSPRSSLDSDFELEEENRKQRKGTQLGLVTKVFLVNFYLKRFTFHNGKFTWPCRDEG